MLKTQPPTTAPTIPSTISRNTPSPVLFTSLLPMNPAINPNTIQAKIDIICLLSTRLLVIFRLYQRQFQDSARTRGAPGFGGNPGLRDSQADLLYASEPCCFTILL